MEKDLEELREALAAGDGTRARALLTEMPAGEDAALQELTRAARTEGHLGALAVELLVERLDEQGMVRRFVAASLLDASAVDDVTQDALISVAAGAAGFRGGSQVSTWVHSIVRRRVVDHLRRQRATSPLPEEDRGPGERMSSMLATRHTVREALAGLPELYREPVVLRDLEGLSYAEIADRLGRPAGTVKAQISRGRALVAGALRGPERDALAETGAEG